MATIYFSNNADSGAGSFRSALSSSASGDTIEPDPSVDWGGETIAIALASPISLSSYKNRVISGGANHRIRFDGQGTAQLFAATSPNVEFVRCDMVRGYRATYGPVIQATNGNPIVVFRDCLFAGNKSDGSAAALDLSSNSSSYKFDITATNCVIMGDAQSFCTSARATAVRLNYCTFVRNLSTPTASSVVVFSNCATRINSSSSAGDFVNVPDSEIADEDWTPDLWQTWDARLCPGSRFLTGATGELTTDFLGHARKPNGAVGAYEGSWLIVADETTLDAPATVDYFELKPTGALTLTTPELALTVEREAAFDSGSIDGAGSFVVVPAGSDASLATLNGADVVQYGAGVLTVSASRRLVEWTADDVTIPVLIQRNIDGEWTTIANAAGGSAEIDSPLTIGETIRVYDGENFTTATVVGGAIAFHPWTVYANTISITVATETRFSTVVQTAAPYTKTTGFILMSEYYNRGETPVLFARIQDSATGDIIDPADVDSISYTAYKIGSSWGTQTRTPIDGHTGVNISTSALSNALVTNDTRWTKDDVGYNFLFEPDARVHALTSTPGSYAVVVTLTFAEANPLPIEFEIEVQ